jgi:uncharacterized membrane protein
MDQPPSQLAINRAASQVLRWGFVISAVLIVAGVALTLARGDDLHTSLESLPTLIDEIGAGRGAGVVGLGILAMVVTPIASTIAVIVACFRIGDRRYAWITSGVLVILAISAGLSAL